MPDARNIRPDDYLALAELRFVIRRFLAFSEAAARAAEIDPQQHQLLLVLKGLRPPERPTIRTTAERLLIQHNSAVELVGRMVERGLVERRTGDRDRREVSLKITARGERVLRRLTLAHRRELKSAAPLLLGALEALLGGDRTERASGVRLEPKTRTNTKR
jgi:DNA-binding MarR family transcriptional regulator